MKLKITEIPQQMRQLIPPGFRLERRGEHDFLIVESIFCPHGHNLMVDSVRIHGEPSISMRVKMGVDTGIVFVDAFWGSHAKLFSFIPTQVTDDTIVEAFCPVCGVSLMEQQRCTEDDCQSEVGILLYLPGSRNLVHVCARIGCPGHEVEIVDVSHDYMQMLSEINFFGASADDMFGEML